MKMSTIKTAYQLLDATVEDPTAMAVAILTLTRAGRVYGGVRRGLLWVRTGAHCPGVVPPPEFVEVFKREDDILLTLEVLEEIDGARDVTHPIGWVFNDGSVWFSSYSGKQSACRYRAYFREAVRRFHPNAVTANAPTR